jgi:hypothetical protein
MRAAMGRFDQAKRIAIVAAFLQCDEGSSVEKQD